MYSLHKPSNTILINNKTCTFKYLFEQHHKAYFISPEFDIMYGHPILKWTCTAFRFMRNYILK